MSSASTTNMTTQPLMLPGSVGELFDKLTILRIKNQHITDAAKRRNVQHEMQWLEKIASELVLPAAVDELVEQLHAVNAQLWKIEDDIRECERQKNFSEPFITLARSVYITNDRRAHLKRQLNELGGSEVIEEKSYAAY